jgi:Flp pilus assembly protein TadG
MNRRNRKGAAVVEFAVVAPLFVLLMMGMIEMGRAVQIQQVLTNASREGARLAAIEGTTEAKVQAAVSQYLTLSGVYGFEGVDSLGNPKGKPCTDALVSVSPPNALPGEAVTVTVTLARDKVSWVQNRFITSDLTAATVFRKEYGE